MLFEESDESYSSSDDVIHIEIPPKPKEVPKELTIEALYQNRQKENTIPQKKRVKVETKKSNNQDIELIKDKINLKELQVPDLQIINESIFNESEAPFPISVFSLLKTECDENLQYPLNNFSLMHTISYYEPSIFEFKEETIYSLLFTLLHDQDERYGLLILKKLDKIPKLDFSKFLLLFREIIYTSNSCLYIYPALLCNISYFDHTQEIQDDIMLLYTSIIMCTCIVKHKYFFILVENFQLLNPNFDLIPDMHSFIFGSQIQSIGNLVTYMRITKSTADFFIVLYTSLVNSLFGYETEMPSNLNEIIDFLIVLTPHLKDLIDSNNEDQLLRSSAILSLIEQIIVASKLLHLITHSQAASLCKALKFNSICENGTYLFLLKEQLHMTLTQIEYITDATLKIKNINNPFFG